MTRYLPHEYDHASCTSVNHDVQDAQSIRHIAEKLGGGGSASEAVDELWELANELDPEGSDGLLDYVEARDDSS